MTAQPALATYNLRNAAANWMVFGEFTTDEVTEFLNEHDAASYEVWPTDTRYPYIPGRAWMSEPAQPAPFIVYDRLGQQLEEFTNPHAVAAYLWQDGTDTDDFVVVTGTERRAGHVWLAVYDEFAPYLMDAPRTDENAQRIDAVEKRVALLERHVKALLATAIAQEDFEDFKSGQE